MNSSKTTLAAFAAVLALTAASSPVLARHRAEHPGYNARAEAIGGPPDSMAGRAETLRECNKESSKFVEYTWGDFQSYQQRACMAEHGQPE